MAVMAGIDIAKEFHWVAVVEAGTGKTLVSRQVDNDPASIEELVAALVAMAAEHGEVTVGIDIVGGVASLFAAMVLAAGLRLVYVPGLAVNRARSAVRGGERKSDPRDARVIADQLRLREDWRQITDGDHLVEDLRVLVNRRRDLVCEQTRRLNRLRAALSAYFPGMERVLKVANTSDLRFLARYTTAAQIRKRGRPGSSGSSSARA